MILTEAMMAMKADKWNIINIKCQSIQSDIVIYSARLMTGMLSWNNDSPQLMGLIKMYLKQNLNRCQTVRMPSDSTGFIPSIMLMFICFWE